MVKSTGVAGFTSVTTGAKTANGENKWVNGNTKRLNGVQFHPSLKITFSSQFSCSGLYNLDIFEPSV